MRSLSVKSTFVLSLILSLFLWVGCDSGSDDDALALGTMRAQINGASWQAANATANRVTAGSLTQVTVSGATVQAQIVSFSITDTGTGTYTIDDVLTPARDVLSASYTAGIGQTFIATSGTIRIDRFDDEVVEGTFSFEAANQAGETVSVTDGQFRVGYGVNIGG